MRTSSTNTLFREQCYIDGAWTDGGSAERITVINPSKGDSIGTVPALDAQTVTSAIDASARAQREWSAQSGEQRGKALMIWYEAIIAHQEELAEILTLEQGKPLREARGEIQSAASYVKWYAEEASRIYGETIPAPDPANRLRAERMPVGVAAAITPWNFPSAMITRKVAPALAAGCSMIVKPSELTPFSALALAALSEKAGFPAGLIQIVTGDPNVVGTPLLESSVVRKLSFTGSTQTGRILMSKCAPTLKRLSMELGGNAPFIVFDDADVELAVKGAIASKFRNAGQTCICSNRILVQSGIHDEFVEKFAAVVGKMRVGDGFDEATEIGPLINEAAVRKVESHIKDAVQQGAQKLTGGRLGSTNHIAPVVLTGVSSSMRVAVEETFGPLAPIFRFDTESEAVAMANATEYGLAAYFFTRDHARSIRVSEALEFGMVGHNTSIITTHVAPFGGVKQSGFGREGSRHGIDDYTSLKYVCSRVGEP